MISNNTKIYSNYPSDIDETMVPLLDALNSFPGVRTYACCEGHGKEQFYIWFGCRDKPALRYVKEVFRIHWKPDNKSFYMHRVELENPIDSEFDKGWFSISVRSDELGMEENDKWRIGEIDRLANKARSLQRIDWDNEI